MHSAAATLWTLFLLGALAGCARSYDLDEQGGALGRGVSFLDVEIPDDCDVRPGLAPRDLACTGLFSDVESKEISPAVRYFEPAYPLWSDDSGKRRWIHLPPGEKIDASDPNNWEFPIGTRLFKEFQWNGRRVETRMYHKQGKRRWVKASYRWSDDESEAKRFVGGDVDIDGETYYIPSAKECDQCHKGREDRALGFEGVLMGLPDAEGLTLAKLREEGLLEGDGMPDDVEIGDDGSGKAARALGWLHTNCGVSCHNDNSASEAYKTDLFLRLDADGIDGRNVDDQDAVTTTVGVETTTERWLDLGYRIVPGVPEASVLYWLAARRNPATPDDQMPPLGSRVVDRDRLTWLGQWIRSMPRDPNVPAKPLAF
ncbi:MAG: hypothetical protein OXU20_00450 [Myxococcales bacterium]|nr:hypothetical protein [Myxococcales bacterium]MDD9971748.1 hypothetical protein [Myxococcales bacterium]